MEKPAVTEEMGVWCHVEHEQVSADLEASTGNTHPPSTASIPK